MKHILTAIVSGGAAGAERGALRAAVDLDLGYGGWSWPEDDVPDVYATRMRPAVSRAMQRRLNVQDSDATLFVMRHGSKEMKFIVDACRAMRKPAKTLVLSEASSTRIPSEVSDALRYWITERRISVLNVVGDGDENDTRDALCWIFDRMLPTSKIAVFDSAIDGLIIPYMESAYSGIAMTADDPVCLSGVTLTRIEDVIADALEREFAELEPRQDTPTQQSGDACSSQRIVSDGANPSPDTEGGTYA